MARANHSSDDVFDVWPDQEFIENSEEKQHLDFHNLNDLIFLDCVMIIVEFDDPISCLNEKCYWCSDLRSNFP